MPAPDHFTSKTPLPKKIGGSSYPADLAEGASDDRQFGVFHGSAYAGIKKISETAVNPKGEGGSVGGVPDGVDDFASNKVK